MDQVKKGSKTLLDFFQASLAKKYKSDKGLDYFTPAPSTDDLKYATSYSKVGERIISAVTKNRRDNCPASK